MAKLNPCYCEQALAYEKLLKDLLQSIKEIEQKVEKTIGEYRQAQKDYESQDE